jgi:serine phosphatase RsbU (regulator of sigma subunit)
MLNALTLAARSLAGGDREVRVRIRSGDELEILGNTFDQMAADLAASYKSLEALNQHLELKVEERTRELEASLRMLHENQAQLIEAERKAAVSYYEREMAIAEQIQTSILPKHIDVPGFEIAASMAPAAAVGGDYYDVVRTDDGGFWLGIGDVSGHGLNAGLVMLMIQSGLATLMRRDPDTEPASLLDLLNRMLYENIRIRLGSDDFATLSLFRFYPDGRFVVAGAHEDALIWRAGTDSCEEMPTKGTWLGVVENVGRLMRNQEGRLEPGDIMVVYTDGITEAQAPSREQFGLTRFAEALSAAHAEPAAGICSRVLDRVKTWSAVQADDQTLVVVRRRSP